jgi:hypothetical protein
LSALKQKKTDKQQDNSKLEKNPHLKKHQWKKGESGNPNGRPKNGFALNDHIRDFANVEGKDKKTLLENVVARVYDEALQGNMSAVNFLADRMLGKPNQSIGIREETNEPIKIIDIEGNMADNNVED